MSKSIERNVINIKTYQCDYISWAPCSNLLQSSIEHVPQVLVTGVKVIQFGGNDIGSRWTAGTFPESKAAVQRRLRLEQAFLESLQPLAPYLVLRLERLGVISC